MEIEKLLGFIGMVRDEIHTLVEKKGYLFDREILEKSKELDGLLNKYYKMFRERGG